MTAPQPFPDRIRRAFRQALAEGVFPGAVLLVQHGGRQRWQVAGGVADLATGEAVRADTCFDLASLTKPLCTTLAVMHLIQSDRLSLEDRLGDVAEVFAPSEKAGIRIRQLLSHQSGFPAWRPYFEILRRQPPAARGRLWRQMLADEPLAYRPGEQTLYSDLDFMALQIVVEAQAGQRLDQYAARELYQPMGLRDLFFTDTALPPLPRPFAATEQCPWRGRVLKGHVHDDNAFALGGVAGHAGLFGTAAAVADLLDLLLAAVKRPQPDQVLDAAQLRRFFQRQPSSDWTLGFDTPAVTGSSSGRHFSASTVGHLGFTGTSFWMDLDREVFVVLLTNRIHPSRTNEGIKAFRPLIHDRIMEVLGYG